VKYIGLPLVIVAFDGKTLNLLPDDLAEREPRV
jgi:hypothetical protein